MESLFEYEEIKPLTSDKEYELLNAHILNKVTNISSPFDLIKSFFNSLKWAQVSKYEKTKFSFMVNRFMAIQYPVLSAKLSRIKISQHGVVDFWRGEMIKKYQGVPQWMYTKTKKTTTKKAEAYKPSNDLIAAYCKEHRCGIKDINDMFRFFPAEAEKEFIEYEKRLDRVKKK